MIWHLERFFCSLWCYKYLLIHLFLISMADIINYERKKTFLILFVVLRLISRTPRPPLLLLQEFLADQCLRPLYFHSVSSDTWLPPSPSLINRSWYWWELNAGKWLPVKALGAAASHPACNPMQAPFACQPLAGSVNRPLCASAGRVLQLVLRLCRLFSLDFHVCAKFLWRFLGSRVVSCRLLLPTCWCFSIWKASSKWEVVPKLSLMHIFTRW